MRLEDGVETHDLDRSVARVNRSRRCEQHRHQGGRCQSRYGSHNKSPSMNWGTYGRGGRLVMRLGARGGPESQESPRPPWDNPLRRQPSSTKGRRPTARLAFRSDQSKSPLIDFVARAEKVT